MPPAPPRRPAPRAASRRSAAARQRTHRIRALAGIAVLLMCLLGARAAFLGTVRAGELSERGRQAQRAEVTLLAQRGAILAADGTDLATDLLAVDVSASPRVIADPRAVADRLGPILKRDPNVLANALSEDKKSGDKSDEKSSDTTA